MCLFAPDARPEEGEALFFGARPVVCPDDLSHPLQDPGNGAQIACRLGPGGLAPGVFQCEVYWLGS